MVLQSRNLSPIRNLSAAEAVRVRGGGQTQINQIRTDYHDLSIGELANRAAQGDRDAETAIKIVKQAAKKAAKYGGKQ